MPSSDEWPRSGFEPFFDYRSSFVHLNINLGSPESCHQYHDDWMARYRLAMEKWDDFDIASWSVRLRQSLKFAFTSTYFALASREARGIGSVAAAYYLAYYAALHAMWGVLFLHPNETPARLTDVTHSKIANVFHASFAAGKGSILRVDVKRVVENLRFLREYYSYRMPFNSPIPDEDESDSAYAGLGGFVKQSLQLANLHSHLIRKAAERCNVTVARIAPDRIPDFFELFRSINSKAHPSRDLTALDPADSQALREYLEQGCGLWPHSVMCDHMMDDFMTYVDETQASPEIVQQVRSLVFGAYF